MNVTLINLWDKGGMLHYSSQLANALAKTENVTIIVPKGSNLALFDDEVAIKTISITTKFTVKTFLTFLKDLFQLRAFLFMVQGTRPDVIHINSNHPFLYLAIPFLSKKYKIFATIHDAYPHPGDKSIKILSVIISSRYAQKIFVHGSNIKKDLVEKLYYQEKKIEVIPHGDYSFFNKWNDNSISEELSVLLFGRILDYKGIQYLIQAEPIISKEIDDYKIIIAGEGSLTKYEHYFTNKDKFEIINEYIPDEAVSHLFQKTSVVVLPYIEASQTGIIPIAYSFHKPVVVTRVGCIPDVVDEGQTGYIVAPKDPESLAAKIIILLKNKELRKKMGDNAYVKMKDELSWDSIAQKIVGFYKSNVYN